MKTIQNKIIKLFIILVILCGVFFGLRANTKAIGGGIGSFGGLHLVTIPCTCTPPAMLIMVYDYKFKIPINLVYWPGYSWLYSNYNIFFSTYMLGSYTPATAACWFYVGVTCVDSSVIGLPTVGILDFMPGTGTSGL